MIDLFAAALANSEQKLDSIDPDARGRRQERDRREPEPLASQDDNRRRPAPTQDRDHTADAPKTRLHDARPSSPASPRDDATREAEKAPRDDADQDLSPANEEVVAPGQNDQAADDDVPAAQLGTAQAVPTQGAATTPFATAPAPSGNANNAPTGQSMSHAPVAAAAKRDVKQAALGQKQTRQTTSSQGQLAIDTSRAPIQMTLPRVIAPNAALPAENNAGQTASTLVSTDDLTVATARLTAPSKPSPRGNTGENAGQGKPNPATTALSDGQIETRGTARVSTTAATLAQNHGQGASSSATQTLTPQPTSLQNDALAPAATRPVIEDLTAATARVRGGGSTGPAGGAGATSTQPAAASSASAAPALANDTSARVAPTVKLTPAQGREVVKQVTVQLTKGAQAGDSTVKIQLRPAELGKVDVKLEISNNTLVKAMVVVEKPETLELLQRDARILERALQDAGLKTNSGGLNFALNDQGGSDQNQDNKDAPRNAVAGSSQSDGAPTEAATDQSNRAGDGLVNLMA
jgi:flagellar hook-length control protein FliK